METYVHRIQYYETDKMGITHHSNYIRWMEEARTDFLAQIGWDYDKLEEAGIFSPVTAIDCRFRRSTTYPDEIRITVRVAEYKGPVLKIAYEMTDQGGKKVFEGVSEHCFLNREGKIIRLARENPGFHETLVSLAAEEQN